MEWMVALVLLMEMLRCTSVLHALYVKVSVRVSVQINA